MPLEIVNSVNGVPIRLTEERWEHIAKEHSEMANMQTTVLQAIQEPDVVYEGQMGELIAHRAAGSLILGSRIYRDFGL